MAHDKGGGASKLQRKPGLAKGGWRRAEMSGVGRRARSVRMGFGLSRPSSEAILLQGSGSCKAGLGWNLPPCCRPSARSCGLGMGPFLTGCIIDWGTKFSPRGSSQAAGFHPRGEAPMGRRRAHKERMPVRTVMARPMALARLRLSWVDWHLIRRRGPHRGRKPQLKKFYDAVRLPASALNNQCMDLAHRARKVCSGLNEMLPPNAVHQHACRTHQQWARPLMQRGLKGPILMVACRRHRSALRRCA